MAVEATQITLFSNVDTGMISLGDASRCEDRLQTAYGNRMENIFHGSGMMNMLSATDFMAESGLTSSVPISRKRSRDSASFKFRAFEFLTEDVESQIYQQQLEIDRFIGRHTEKVKTEIEEIRKRNSRRLATAYERIMNILKTKEEQLLKIGQMNRLLEQKVKSISVENQIWRESAQSNQATANALRNNLHQVLSEIQLQQHRLYFAGDNDAQSHCGSNSDEDHRQENAGGRYGGLNRRCRNCGKDESSVLLLPCRHLCVCSVCDSSVMICPVCKSTKFAGVHVNMS